MSIIRETILMLEKTVNELRKENEQLKEGIKEAEKIIKETCYEQYFDGNDLFCVVCLTYDAKHEPDCSVGNWLERWGE